MNYEDFKQQVRAIAQARSAQAGLIALPELRTALADCDAATFDRHVLQLQRDGLVHLMTHVDGTSLPGDVQKACVRHPSGTLLYWMRWLE